MCIHVYVFVVCVCVFVVCVCVCVYVCTGLVGYIYLWPSVANNILYRFIKFLVYLHLY